MNKKALTWGCIILGLGGLFLGGLAAVFIGLGASKGPAGPGENSADNTTSATSTITSPKVPEPLKQVFEQAGQSIGVPGAFLAAVSSIECTGFWGNFSVPDRQTKWNAKLTGWITANADVDHERACSKSHRHNAGCVWGPMQFLDTTWGMAKHTCDTIVPHPTLRENSIGAKAGGKTGHNPASILNIKDSIYGAAILLSSNKGSGDWNDESIRRAARRYCNGGTNENDDPTPACRVQKSKRVENGRTVREWEGYGAGVLRKYKELSGQNQ